MTHKKKVAILLEKYAKTQDIEILGEIYSLIRNIVLNIQRKKDRYHDIENQHLIAHSTAALFVEDLIKGKKIFVEGLISYLRLKMKKFYQYNNMSLHSKKRVPISNFQSYEWGDSLHSLENINTSCSHNTKKLPESLQMTGNYRQVDFKVSLRQALATFLKTIRRNTIFKNKYKNNILAYMAFRLLLKRLDIRSIRSDKYRFLISHYTLILKDILKEGIYGE